MTKTTSPYAALAKAVTDAQIILVLQPDSPDADSLGSALGLEEILGDLGKTVVMYSYKEPEPYLRTMEGWDRVLQDLPKAFDLTILVDTGSPALIKSALEHHYVALTAKPFFIIDHHVTRSEFGFVVSQIVEHACAAAEVITNIAIDRSWPINAGAAAKLSTAILADSLNLTTPESSERSVRMLAELVKRGANLYELYKLKRTASALTPELVHLKGRLLQSIEFHLDGTLAIAEITPDLVARYKDVHEPYTLILSDMQWAKGVELVAVFKNYGTKINVPLRSTLGYAAPVAAALGGGGHDNAAAYRCKTVMIQDEKQLLIETFSKFKEQAHAFVQHADSEG